jgi:uncharacterized protein
MQIMADLMKGGRPASGVMQILPKMEAQRAKVFARTGRNEPCPCGSGAKFKKCHGALVTT